MIKRKGFFLIFALWLFLLLSIFCLGLGFRSFITTKKTKLSLNRTRAFYMAVSGVKIAQSLLIDDRDGVGVDNLKEAWAVLGREENSEPITINFSGPKKEGSLTVLIEDESSRLNINSLAEEAMPLENLEGTTLQVLFYILEINEEVAKINYILDYIDDDDDDERAGGSEDRVKNGPLSCIEELLHVNGITADDYEKIKDLITVLSKDKVNINTASQEVWETIINASEIILDKDEEDVIAGVLRVRLGYDGIEGNDDDGYYGEGGEELPEGLEDLFSTESDIFRIISEADIEGVKKRIVCIMDRTKEEEGILFWHEE